MVLQMSVIFEKELYLRCNVSNVLMPLFFLACVCKCAYPHLTDLLSESGAALRIDTDTLSAQVHIHAHTRTHVHTLFTLPVSSVS